MDWFNGLIVGINKPYYVCDQLCFSLIGQYSVHFGLLLVVIFFLNRILTVAVQMNLKIFLFVLTIKFNFKIILLWKTNDSLRLMDDLLPTTKILKLQDNVVRF